MTVAERLNDWNRWYDGLSREWRFQYVLWPLLALGAINLLLTVAVRFPFALLVVLGFIGLAAIRVPYVLGWIAPKEGAPAGTEGPAFQISGAGWMGDLNRRYDAMPEHKRMWVIPAVLIIAGFVNMALTIGAGFPFGLLFLLALLAVVVVRGTYTAGWLKAAQPATSIGTDANFSSQIEHAPPAAIGSDWRPAEPAVPVAAAPEEAHPVKPAEIPPSVEAPTSGHDRSGDLPAIHEAQPAHAPDPATQPPETQHPANDQTDKKDH